MQLLKIAKYLLFVSIFHLYCASELKSQNPKVSYKNVLEVQDEETKSGYIVYYLNIVDTSENFFENEIWYGFVSSDKNMYFDSIYALNTNKDELIKVNEKPHFIINEILKDTHFAYINMVENMLITLIIDSLISMNAYYDFFKYNKDPLVWWSYLPETNGVYLKIQKVTAKYYVLNFKSFKHYVESQLFNSDKYPYMSLNSKKSNKAKFIRRNSNNLDIYKAALIITYYDRPK